VITTKGAGRVVAQEILAQKLVVELDDHRRVMIGRADIQGVEPRGRRSPGPGPGAETDVNDRPGP
jgi:hypothetical protein